MTLRHGMFAGVLALATMGFGGAAKAQACTVNLGGILTLTGTQGDIGKAIGDTAQMAIDQINEAGGIRGCRVNFILRDDQGQPQVGVDAAKQLVEVNRVQALIGTIGSGVSLPILTSVTAPARVTQVSCCSTSPTFTQLAIEGRTGGYWFRTIPTSLLQAVASANQTIDNGWRRTAVLYVNTDFGVNMARDYERAIKALGGTVTMMVPFNENQTSYRAEVQRALSQPHDSMMLIGFPQDGSTVAREWISLGGSQNLMLNNSLRSDQFLTNVGARFLNNAWGMDNAQVSAPSVEQFNRDFQARFNRPARGPGIHTVYDAVVVTALAMHAAGANADGTAIRDQMRRVISLNGEVHGTGVAGIKGAMDAITAGRTIRYVGSTGPFQFDANGDVTGPALIWRIQNGQFGEVRTLDMDAMNALFARVNAAPR
jgi:neutral amino acid transport system substrate-binding protein